MYKNILKWTGKIQLEIKLHNIILFYSHLTKALSEFHPDVMVYNAGTDILKGDRLGLLAVSADGIIKRDEMVFQMAREKNIPIVMLTSGGYLKKTARIIATSIMNLNDLGLIAGPLSRH